MHHRFTASAFATAFLLILTACSAEQPAVDTAEPTLTPSVASAAMQLEERIAGMPRLHARALSMAEALSGVEGVSVLPDPPHTNMMHVFLRCDAEAAQDARDRFAHHIAQKSDLHGKRVHVVGQFAPLQAAVR